jgi:hypothetical protein
MPSWTDVAGFCFAVLVAPLILLHLWAFMNPDGNISKRLHPSHTDQNEMRYLRRQFVSQEELRRGSQRAPQCHPFEDVELVTTVRRGPRRRRADNTIGGPQEPGP